MPSASQDRAGDLPIRGSNGEDPLNARVVARLGLRLGFKRQGARPEAQEDTTQASCNHTRHVGTCPSCQRAQLARWREQLARDDEAVPQQRA